MNQQIILPNLSVKYSCPIPQTQLLLVGGGKQPAEEWLISVAKDREIWCIDHGLDICHKLGLRPEFLLGDFDSCQKDSLAWAKEISTTIKKLNPQKDFTDTQAVFEEVKGKDAYCILTGGFGNRLDHTYSTFFSFGHSFVRGCMADERETVCFLRDNEWLSLTLDILPKAVSLLPISQTVTGVTTTGLYWELSHSELTQSNPYAVSNILADDRDSHSFTVSIQQGILAIYLCWKE